ncbi:hypothetical protein [Neobacillus mesonae]|uniref:hypothetical protein n=1 Tax=Neobacillus mesonae TaxID=1193713 RepID=UPI00203AAEB7|nr:hypothetical protein [Neobacillus mesonae]MCM3568523.1 hypothetical protein [Neobacillus mesonae]
MITRQMIEQIVQEVIKQLAANENHQDSHDKPKLLVIGETSFVEPDYLAKMKTKWDIISDNESEKVKWDQVDQVLILHATQDLLVKGALGIFDTRESKLLSCCLLESIPVTMIPTVFLEKQLFNRTTLNKPYVLQLQKYKEQLENFGACVETWGNFLTKSEKAAVPDQEESITEKKKLISQRDIQDYKESIIVVDKDTIITPLARDTARELGKSIKVIEVKGAEK